MISAAYRRLDVGVEEIIRFILQLPATSYPALLDSCKYNQYGLYDGRFLIAAFNPELCLQLNNNELYQFSRRGEQIYRGDIFDHIDRLFQEWQFDPTVITATGLGDADALPCAAGAAIGLFSYDLGRYFEQLPMIARVSHPVPDLFISFYTVLIVHDYLTSKTTLIACTQSDRDPQIRLKAAQAEIERSFNRLNNSFGNISNSIIEIINQTSFNTTPNYHSNFNREQYCQAVAQIKRHIELGDIYQANLTQQYQIDLSGLAAETIWLRVRSQSPVPFSAFIKTPEWTVISASPERFLRRQGDEITAFPIKGTRPRGITPEQDEQLARELVASEKDIAENIMIVDLLRNDLGRVCQIGSIDASQLLTIQTLPTLFHLVSKVSGKLRDNITLSKLLAAAFPCGSITGAPKLRAMEIIETIERVRRGLSMGSIGWLGYNGDLDLNVAIRTLFIRDHQGYLNVGGAVVADSDPAAEYRESQLKAQALFKAIGLKEE
jgi:para-aminobenzoate synthetase component I